MVLNYESILQLNAGVTFFYKTSAPNVLAFLLWTAMVRVTYSH